VVDNRELNISDRVHMVLKYQLCLTVIGNGQRLREDLDADSLDFVELSMELEEEFDIYIAIVDFDSVKTVQDVIDFVNKKVMK